MSQKGHHDVYIMKVGSEYRVRPAVWSSDGQEVDEVDSSGNSQKVKPGLRFRNLTEHDVLIVLPDILDAGGDRQPLLGPKDSKPNGKPADLHVARLKSKSKGASAEMYRYSVIVFEPDGTRTAVGESEPVVIIDPPPA